MTPNDVLAVFCVVATITILAVVALQPSPDERMIRAWVKAEIERMHTNQQPPTGAELNECVSAFGSRPLKRLAGRPFRHENRPLQHYITNSFD